MLKIYREVDIMRALNHPNIVKLHHAFETRRKLYLVMEYCGGGDLLQYVKSHGVITEREARGMFQQIVSAVSYIHRSGIVHRDLKLNNILLDKNNNIKIGDFGLSNFCSPWLSLSSLCGTPAFLAPEIMFGRTYMGSEVDTWSLGVCLYFLLMYNLPFAVNSLEVFAVSLRMGLYVPPHISKSCKDLLKKLLTVDPRKRATMQQRKLPIHRPALSVTSYIHLEDEHPASSPSPRARPPYRHLR